MRSPVPPLTPSAFASLASLLLAGCLFDSHYSVQGPPIPTTQSEVLDTVMASDAVPARRVDLYQPLWDPGLKPGQVADVETAKPVNVKDHADSGRIVQYRLIRQRFGSWSPELEFKWNWFQLQANWIFPQALPDTTGLANGTPALYDMLHGEDRFTRYFDSAAAPAILNLISNSTKAGAIGVMVKSNPAGDTVLVSLVVAGSPAGRAGIVPGMAILAVGDSAVVGDSALARFARINSGDSGSTVRLTVKAPGGDPMVLEMVRVPVSFPTVLIDSIEGVAHVTITGFTPNTVGDKSTWTELRDALIATRGSAATILDLRGNGGGELDVAMRMCDEIIPSGRVIIRQVQRRFDEMALAPIETAIAEVATDGGVGEKSADGSVRKYLLLADTGTASAAEIFVVSLREGAGVPQMGQTTFGKGVGQIVRSTPGKGLSLITFLKFTSAAGLDYHKHGLVPDYRDTTFGETLLAHAVAKAKELVGGSPAAQLVLGPKGEALGKRSSAESRALAAEIAAAEWNRVQALRPGVRDLILPAQP